MAQTPFEVVTLHIVGAYPYPTKEAPIYFREFKYRRVKSLLTAMPTEDRDPPHGLRRIRIKDLPALGGLFNTTVAAYSKEEAIAALIKVLKKRKDEAAQELKVMTSNIEALQKFLP